MQEITVLEMIRYYLKEHNYDGLYNEGTCGCLLDDLAPCGCDGIVDCLAGVRKPIPEDVIGATFWIGPKEDDSDA